MDTYAQHTDWQRYQPFFPERWRAGPLTPREETWEWQGLQVHLDRLDAPEAPVKVVVLHGAGAYGRIMAPAAVLAARHGYATVAPDLPGYGLTRVPWSRFTWETWIDCACALIEAERDRPIVLLGVSLGGMLAWQVASRVKVDALAVTTLVDPREEAVRADFARWETLGRYGIPMLGWLRGATDGLPLPMRHLSKMHRISNDPTLSALCANDPLGGGSWVPGRFLRTLMDTPLVVEPEDFRRCPVLLAHPGEDRMTDIAHSRRFFDRIAGTKRMVVLEGASHMPTESPGVEILEAEVLELLRSVR
jgi:alpha-beta hydrolase superfamily lysophospholipase